MNKTAYLNEFSVGKNVIRIMEYKNQRIITLNGFSLAHDTTNVTKCFYDQRKRFVLNKDFYQLNGAEMMKFRQKYHLGRMSVLNVFTLSGYERLANFAFIDELDPVRLLLEKEYFNKSIASAISDIEVPVKTVAKTVIKKLKPSAPKSIEQNIVDAEALAIGKIIKNFISSSFGQQIQQCTAYIEKQNKIIDELRKDYAIHSEALLDLSECTNNHKDNIDYLLQQQEALTDTLQTTASVKVEDAEEKVPHLLTTAEAKKYGWYCAKELAERLELRKFDNNELNGNLIIDLGKHLGVIPDHIDTDVIDTENYVITLSSNNQRTFCFKRKAQDKIKAWLMGSASKKAAYVMPYKTNGKGHKAGQIRCQGFKLGTTKHSVVLPPAHRAYAIKQNHIA